MAGAAGGGADEVLQPDSDNHLKTKFEEVFKLPSKAIRHEKTSVLLLSWDPEHDDLDVADEVKRLEQVFKKLYEYKVYNKQIKGKTKVPQQQMARHMTEFVDEEDEEQALLIIYYAGHGYSKPDTREGDLNLIGGLGAPPAPNAHKDQAKQQKMLDRDSIVWSEVESAIRHTRADILLILDCCFAGRLGPAYRDFHTRTYEFLGACQSQEKTRSPGKESFTSALIWALEQFSAGDEAFSTWELRHKIRSYDHFPEGQKPVLAHRAYGCEHIVVSKKGHQPKDAQKAPSKAQREAELSKQGCIDLRFHFDHSVEEKHVLATAETLKKLMDSTKTIGWFHITYLKNNAVARKYVERWRGAVRSRRGTGTPSPVERAQQPLEPGALSLAVGRLAPPTLALQIPGTHSATVVGHEASRDSRLSDLFSDANHASGLQTSITPVVRVPATPTTPPRPSMCSTAAASEQTSKDPSLPQEPQGEEQAVPVKCNRSNQVQHDDDSVIFHLQAIWKKGGRMIRRKHRNVRSGV